MWADNSTQDPNDFKNIQVKIRETKFSELTQGQVTLKIQYSGINYKDALAVTGNGKILRNLPLIPGVDFAGVVVDSRSDQFSIGDPVVMNACNLGEKICGGFSQYTRVNDDILMHRPKGLSARESMILGTAGFTASLAIHQLEKNGLTPQKGPVLVTGATGGVGSIAISLLNKLGYETEAWTRKDSQEQWLKKCGAAVVTNITNKDFKTQPLESYRWSGAIDNVGGEILSSIIPRIGLWGSVASIGLAMDHKLATTLYPFILRGVNLLGVSSNNCPFELRKQLWQRLGEDLKPENLDELCSEEVSLSQIPETAKKIIDGKHIGRILVKIE